MAIYDCFMFYNELELLRLRFELLSPYVDHFVISEMSRTLRGEPKPLVFWENRELFRDFWPKIVYVSPSESDIPEFTGGEGEDWSLEIFQRNFLAQGLGDALSDDLIMVGDIDEISSPQAMEILASRYGTEKRSPAGEYAPYFDALESGKFFGLLQKFFCYYMNCQSKLSWSGAVMALRRHMTTPQDMRNQREYLPKLPIFGGWHFSYLGGAKRILKKMSSIVDGGRWFNELKREKGEKWDATTHIAYAMKHGLDAYSRSSSVFNRIVTYQFIPPATIGLPNLAEVMRRHPDFFMMDESLYRYDPRLRVFALVGGRDASDLDYTMKNLSDEFGAENVTAVVTGEAQELLARVRSLGVAAGEGASKECLSLLAAINTALATLNDEDYAYFLPSPALHLKECEIALREAVRMSGYATLEDVGKKDVKLIETHHGYFREADAPGVSFAARVGLLREDYDSFSAALTGEEDVYLAISRAFSSLSANRRVLSSVPAKAATRRTDYLAPAIDMRARFSDFLVRTSIVISSQLSLSEIQWMVTLVRANFPERSEIIFVDDGLATDAVEWLSAQPDINLLPYEEHGGYTACYTPGIEKVSGGGVQYYYSKTLCSPTVRERRCEASSTATKKSARWGSLSTGRSSLHRRAHRHPQPPRVYPRLTRAA